jgi:hypothetical protein
MLAKEVLGETLLGAKMRSEMGAGSRRGGRVAVSMDEGVRSLARLR